MLEALGADCAGAVAVLPEGGLPSSGREGVRPLDEKELVKLIEDLPRDPLGVGLDPEGVRLSLGGVQQKLVLVRAASGEFGQPLGGAPSTCLLKPEHDLYRDLATNEAFCMRVVAAAGLEAAATELLTIGSKRCLYVERFDRTTGDDGRVARLHQEDMCQALGILPDAKYEADGGPSVAAIVALLRGTGSRRAALDVKEFVRAVLANFLLGNSDAHGKNFSLLHDPVQGARLAPLYDVVSTAVYPELVRRMAMAIGDTDDPEQVDLASWGRLGDLAGLGGQLTGFICHWAVQVRSEAEACRQVALDEGWHRPVVDEIVKLCAERAERLTGA
jgi:serine/threonine-protein kinase HipA